MRDALAQHDRTLRASIAAHRGVVFKTIGDAFCGAFALPADAVAAAVDAQRALATQSWPPDVGELRVRMGIHTGSALERDGDYFGPTVNRVARLMSIGYGGQILVSAATASLLEGGLERGTSLRDLGAHRLRDLSHAETTFQVEADGLQREFPALASLDTRPNNLPSQLSSFVGRERELDALRTLLTEHRLVTLTGTGGIGKTRLALQLAAGIIDRYRDGAWFADLGAVTDPDLVAQTIASALRVRENRSEPILETLVREVAHKNLLLVIDNAEHLLERVASVTKTMLGACAQMTAVVTSREALHIGGEAIFRLEPLPDAPAHVRADDLMRHDSTRLLLERARAIVRDLTVTDADADDVGALCRKLEGIPLAIELAAARVTTLSLHQLNERLGERLALLTSRDTTLARHRTLRETIDWSYRLLDGDEKRVFAAAAVFTGGFTLDACERVVPKTQTATLDVLQSLTEKSFLQVELRGDCARFRALDVIREFGLVELAATGETAEIEAAHARYYAGLAARGRGLAGDAASAWHATLDEELPNVRIALAWQVLHDPVAGAGFALDVSPYWRVRSMIAEARSRLGALLAADALGRRDRAALLCAAAGFAAMQDDFAESSRYANAALLLSEKLGDVAGTGDALFRLAEIEHRRGDLTAARTLYDRARELFRQSRNDRGETLCIGNAGMLARQHGDYQSAKELLDEALARATASGERRIAGEFVIALGWVNLSLADVPSAQALFERAFDEKTAERDPYGVCGARHGMATAALADGRLDVALEQFRSTIDVALELHLQTYVFRGLYGVSAVLARRGVLDDAARFLGLAEKMFRESGRALRDSIAYDVASRALEALEQPEQQTLLAQGERLQLGDAFEKLRSIPTDSP